MMRRCFAAGSFRAIRARNICSNAALKTVALLRHYPVVNECTSGSSSRTFHCGAFVRTTTFMSRYARRQATSAAAAKFTNAFAVLELPVPDFNSRDKGRHLTEQDVKKAFRAAAIRTHPDRGGTAAAFRAATDAYEECLRIVLARQSGARSMRDGQQATASERSTATQDAHDSWVSAMDLLINAQDLEKAWRLWQSRIYSQAEGSVGMEIIEVGLRLCAASELREALGLLAEVEGRSLFRDQEQRVAAYNSLLWHCHMKGNQGDMDLILEILAVMDRKGLQPDLGLLDLQLFTFFPRS